MTEVEEDEVLRIVRHVSSKVAADDAVPRRVVLVVELILDVRCDVFLDGVLLHRLRGDIDRVLLHVLRHVGTLDHGLPIRRPDDDVVGAVETENRTQKTGKKIRLYNQTHATVKAICS